MQVDALEHLIDGLSTHAGVEFIAMFLDGIEVGLLGEDLATFERRHTGVDDQVGLEVQHPLDIPQGHVEHETNTGRQRLQEPDMCRWAGQFDVAHALTSHLGLSDLDTTFLADHAAMLESLVLPTQALIILHRPEDLCTEQPIAFRLECAVVDRLGFLDLPKRP